METKIILKNKTISFLYLLSLIFVEICFIFIGVRSIGRFLMISFIYCTSLSTESDSFMPIFWLFSFLFLVVVIFGFSFLFKLIVNSIKHPQMHLVIDDDQFVDSDNKILTSIPIPWTYVDYLEFCDNRKIRVFFKPDVIDLLRDQIRGFSWIYFICRSKYIPHLGMIITFKKSLGNPFDVYTQMQERLNNSNRAVQ